LPGNAHYLGVIPVAAFPDVARHLVKRIALAVVRADNHNAPAPDQQCGGRIQHLAHILVECRLVDNYLALQAPDIGRV